MTRTTHTLLLTLLLLLAAGDAAAQSWKEMLKQAATTLIDKATDGELTRRGLIGNWDYTAPGVKFESENWAAEAGGAALETSVAGKLERAYLLAGIEPGACGFSFDDKGAFTANFGSRTLSSTYEFDAATHAVALRFTKGKYDLCTVPGHAYISGSELQVVFPVTRVVDMITAVGEHITALSTVSQLLESYDNVYVGFRFDRRE